MRVRYEDVETFEGALSRYNKKTTIAILIARSENRSELMRQRRMDIFTDNAKDRARSSEYNIILTDELNIYSDLINFVESHPLDKDSSNINFFFHFYHIVIIFFLVLIWLSINQNKEDVTNHIY
jgi:hypothetical protein